MASIREKIAGLLKGDEQAATAAELRAAANELSVADRDVREELEQLQAGDPLADDKELARRATRIQELRLQQSSIARQAGELARRREQAERRERREAADRFVADGAEEILADYDAAAAKLAAARDRVESVRRRLDAAVTALQGVHMDLAGRGVSPADRPYLKPAIADRVTAVLGEGARIPTRPAPDGPALVVRRDDVVIERPELITREWLEALAASGETWPHDSTASRQIAEARQRFGSERRSRVISAGLSDPSHPYNQRKAAER